MPDRRRVAAKAIIVAGAYLHPNFYVGDQDKKLWQIQSEAVITDIDANFLESWMWRSTRHWRPRSKTQFSRRSMTRQWREVIDLRPGDGDSRHRKAAHTSSGPDRHHPSSGRAKAASGLPNVTPSVTLDGVNIEKFH